MIEVFVVSVRVPPAARLRLVTRGFGRLGPCEHAGVHLTPAYITCSGRTHVDRKSVPRSGIRTAGARLRPAGALSPELRPLPSESFEIRRWLSAAMVLFNLPSDRPKRVIYPARRLCRSFAVAVVAVLLFGACDGSGELGPANPNASLRPASITSSPSTIPTPTATVDRVSEPGAVLGSPGSVQLQVRLRRLWHQHAGGACGRVRGQSDGPGIGGPSIRLGLQRIASAGWVPGVFRCAEDGCGVEGLSLMRHPV
jgi:hypothetical protein